MPDLLLQRRSVLTEITLRAPTSLVSARVLPPAARMLFRGDAEAAEACEAAFGVPLPIAANSAAASGGRAALWLGPDEWLLLSPENELDEISAGLSERLKGIGCSLVDISHRQVAIEVSGSHAAALLNACVLLDLDEQAFPVGASTRTIFAKAEIVLWRKDADCFHVEVWRSFAPYLAGLLTEASRGMPVA